MRDYAKSRSNVTLDWNQQQVNSLIRTKAPLPLNTDAILKEAHTHTHTHTHTQTQIICVNLYTSMFTCEEETLKEEKKMTGNKKEEEWRGSVGGSEKE